MNPSEAKGRARCTVLVSELTDGILDPAQPMLGPLAAGGTIVGNTAPGCWGPMITPRIRGGHEVTRPVFVDGAMPGDAVILRIRDINVTSVATASGHDRWVEGHYLGDPYAAPKCPNCGTFYPDTYFQGIGQQAVRCVKCNTPVTPFQMVNGYTVVFDDTRQVGVTVPKEAAERIAHSANQFAALPESSAQHSILTFAPHDLVGIATRLRPFLGQLGTTPGVRMPDSHNAGDFGSALVGAPMNTPLPPSNWNFEPMAIWILMQFGRAQFFWRRLRCPERASTLETCMRSRVMARLQAIRWMFPVR
jgi:formamidase